MEFKELKNLSTEELSNELKKLRGDLEVHRLKLKMNQDKQSHLPRNFRRQIAQILTILHSR